MAGKRHSSECILELGRRPAAQLVGTFRGAQRVQQAIDFRRAFAIGLPLQIGCGAKTENCLLQIDYAGAQIVSLALERLWAVRRYNGRSSATSLPGQ